MDHQYIINELARNKHVFKQMLSGLDEAAILFRVQPDKWCPLEIICHLYDEERDDFRTRVRHVLEIPQLPMTSIDPPGWVSAHKYMEQDFEEMLYKFLAERDASIKWLNGLESPEWDNEYNHPKLGALTAEMLLANWLAHDYLHIRQLTGNRHAYLADLSGQEISYAGSW